MKVAFATSEGVAVDEHFGRCLRFDIYELTADQATLLASRSVPADSPDQDLDGRIGSRLDLLADCAILCVASIGGPAAARVIRAGIHPIRVAEDTSIVELSARLCGVLAGKPPPWLRKVLRQQGPEAAPVWTPR